MIDTTQTTMADLPEELREVVIKTLILTENDKMVASDKAANDYFGASIAINSDGTRVVIGAPYAKPEGSIDGGVVYIFSYDGVMWAEEAKLTSSDKTAHDYFGISVSISLDGSRVAVGAYGQDDGVTDAGAVYIFLRTNTTWTQETKIVANDRAASDRFGHSVAISSDGSRVVVGAYGANNYVGAAYIFLRTSTTWAQEAKLLVSGKTVIDLFGSSVAISSDGTRVVVGAIYQYEGVTDAGAAYIFLRTDTNWQQEAKIVASDGFANDYFGRSVAISMDGSRVVIGASAAEPGDILNAGAAYIFLRTDINWHQEVKLTPSNRVIGDQFGGSVSISSDGSRVAVGACGSGLDSNARTGGAYIFLRTDSGWVQEFELLASNKATFDQFGYSVSISGDGVMAAVGAYGSNPGGTIDAGAAYQYNLNKI